MSNFNNYLGTGFNNYYYQSCTQCHGRGFRVSDNLCKECKQTNPLSFEACKTCKGIGTVQVNTYQTPPITWNTGGGFGITS